MPSFHTKLTALAGLFALLAAAPAGAVIIDDFGGGTAPANYGAATNLFETGGVILGGERDVTMQAPSGFSLDYGVSGGQMSTAATAQTISGTLLRMSWDGVDGSAGFNTGNFNIDLTDGGLSDRFILEVTGFGSNPTLGTTIGIYGATSIDQNFAGTNILGVGVFELPFSSINLQTGAGASANAVTAIRLSFAPIVGDNITIDRFCTGNASGCVGGGSTAVPEPSTWLLMAGGLALLGLRRRRRP